jgi:formylglycine-generating enzyme required for sulfatase activity
VLPCGTSPEDLSFFGLFDVLGNVSEWTESFFPKLTQEGEPRPDLSSRIAKGLYWDVELDATGNLVTVHDCPVTAVERIGFRCAKSAGNEEGESQPR